MNVSKNLFEDKSLPKNHSLSKKFKLHSHCLIFSHQTLFYSEFCPKIGLKRLIWLSILNLTCLQSVAYMRREQSTRGYGQGRGKVTFDELFFPKSVSRHFYVAYVCVIGCMTVLSSDMFDFIVKESVQDRSNHISAAGNENAIGIWCLIAPNFIDFKAAQGTLVRIKLYTAIGEFGTPKKQ